MQWDKPVFDFVAVVNRMRLFEHWFREAEFRELAEYLGTRFEPQTVLTWDAISEAYPHYERLLLRESVFASFIEYYLPKLQPFTQAPFPLPDGQIIQGPWLGDYKIKHFQKLGIDADFVDHKRILDIGCNAGFDTFYLAALGAPEVLGIEPSPFCYQAMFLRALYYSPNVNFLKTRWQDISSQSVGQFDMINCQGILYHEPYPQLLLEACFDLLKPGGILVLETHVSLGDERQAMFVEGAFWGDENWWWLPTCSTVTGMLRASGFIDAQTITRYPIPSRNPNDPDRTVEGVPVGERAYFTALRPADTFRRKPR